MSTALDLDWIRPGFADPVRSSQISFRALMEAVAHPGSHARFNDAVEPPAGLSLAAATVSLTLLDFETKLWLDPALRGGEAEAWLRFHCGCPLTTEAADAAFALVTDVAQAPKLDRFNLGDARYPDRSTTVILQVEGLDGGAPVVLTGPGVKNEVVVAPRGLPGAFWEEMRDNNAKFQFGVDVLIVSGRDLMAIPRSSHMQMQGG